MASPTTANRYQERINLALSFIHDNIDQPLSLDKLAEISHLSAFHFHRLFKTFVGENLNHYVRRLRLERGAFRLRYTRDPVHEIASQCGYSTVPAFTRAFSQAYGTPPSNYRMAPTTPAAQESWSGTAANTSVPANEIVDFPRRKVVYVRRSGRYDHAAQQAWAALGAYAGSRGLFTADSWQVGVTYDSPVITDEDLVRYEACITVDDSVRASGEFGTRYLHAGPYCVFHVTGRYQDLWQAYAAIYGTWVKSFAGRLANAPGLALYRDTHSASPIKHIDICIPIEHPP